MSLVEAAIVVPLRQLYYPLDPRQLFPLALLSHADLALELGREVASVVMMVAVAVLAERGWARRVEESESGTCRPPRNGKPTAKISIWKSEDLGRPILSH